MPLISYLPQLQEAATFFAIVMTEMAVLFIGITFLIGVLLDLIPAQRVAAMMSGRRGRGYLISAGLGALTPFCSCSTVPLTAGLLRANAGFGPTMTFLFTSPLVNPMLVALLWMALGIEFTAIYVSAALTFTILIGYLLDRLGFQRFIKPDILGSALAAPQNGQLGALDDVSLRSAAAQLYADKARLGIMWRDSVAQFRTFLPFIAVGVAVGAITHGFVPTDFLVSFAGADNPWAIPAAAAIGIPLYLRAGTMVPMIMPLAAKGVALGGIAALIIGAAGASIPEIIMLNRMFRLPPLLAFLASVFMIAIITGYTFEAIMG